MKQEELTQKAAIGRLFYEAVGMTLKILVETLKMLARWIKTLLFLTAVVISALVGAGLSASFTNWEYQISNTPCIVSGATVVYCERLENENFYIWNVVATRNLEVVQIKHIVSKSEKTLPPLPSS